MDVIKDQSQRKKSVSKAYALLGLGLLVAMVCAFATLDVNQGRTINRDEVLIGRIQHGDFLVEVAGYGSLRSDRQKLLTSMSSATVEEIVAKPGAELEADSVILRLSNPELEQELVAAQQELALQKATLRQLKLQHTREILEEEAALDDLRAQHEITKAKWAALTDLRRGIVSELDYQETKVKNQQLARGIEKYERRFEQLAAVHKEAIIIQRELINQSEGNYLSAKRRRDGLTVRAELQGVLQELHVELGQSISVGDKLALIGSTQDLVALIKVPQAKAEYLQVGQEAIVDTRADEIPGEVMRIAPTVEDGTVTVEARLLGPLPGSARPNLNIDATIIVDRLANTYFVERPANTAAFSERPIFKLFDDQATARRMPMRFGAESGRFIQVLSAVKAGERIILSDMSKFDGSQEVTIN